MRTIVILAGLMLAGSGVAQAKDMKSCNADWKTAKAAHTTVKHNDFMASCLKGPSVAAPAPAATPVAKPGLFHRTSPAAPATRPAMASAPAAVAAGGAPNGATAVCKDGTYSMSAHHSGSCSHHGGVKQFLK